jgi:hypothetical protein
MAKTKLRSEPVTSPINGMPANEPFAEYLARVEQELQELEQHLADAKQGAKKLKEDVAAKAVELRSAIRSGKLPLFDGADQA